MIVNLFHAMKVKSSCFEALDHKFIDLLQGEVSDFIVDSVSAMKEPATCKEALVYAPTYLRSSICAPLMSGI